MLPRVIDSLALVVLWVCTLLVVLALAGMVIAVIPIGWAPMFLYACIGLGCGWLLYKRTVKPVKPVTQMLAVQCLFVLAVSLVCFVLGFFEWFGFTHHESQIAALPVIFFGLVFLRRAVLSTNEPSVGSSSVASNIVLLIAYVWMAIAIAYVMACMVGTFVTDFFGGVSLLVSPLNPLSWIVIYLWFLPAFLLRALGRKMRGGRA